MGGVGGRDPPGFYTDWRACTTPLQDGVAEKKQVLWYNGCKYFLLILDTFIE